MENSLLILLEILIVTVILFLIAVIVYLFYCKCRRPRVKDEREPSGLPLNHASVDPQRASGKDYPPYEPPGEEGEYNVDYRRSAEPNKASSVIFQRLQNEAIASNRSAKTGVSIRIGLNASNILITINLGSCGAGTTDGFWETDRQKVPASCSAQLGQIATPAEIVKPFSAGSQRLKGGRAVVWAFGPSADRQRLYGPDVRRQRRTGRLHSHHRPGGPAQSRFPVQFASENTCQPRC